MPASDRCTIRPLIIVDNSLIDERGHHLALATTLAKVALAEGRKVVIYAHQALDPARLPEGIDLRPVFTLSVYELFARKMLQHDMGVEMRQVLARIARDHPQGGQLLFHTADAYTFCAVADWLEQQAPNQGHWDIHLATPYEPKLMPGFAFKMGRLHRALWALARFRRDGVALYFWTETARLAEFYRRAYTLRSAVLELPAPQWANDPQFAGLLRPGKLTLLFLGAARDEKGFLHLPGLAEEIAGRDGLADRVVMRLQRSAPIAGMHPEIRAAFDMLACLPFVEIVEGALELVDYAREMRACDMTLLLYSPVNYFARGSGIVMESLCSGKHVLAMRGTFMERLDHEGMAHFGTAPREWVDHVAALAADLDATRAAAARAGSIFAARFSAKRYLDKLQWRERFNRHFDSIHSLGMRQTLPILVASPPERTCPTTQLRGRAMTHRFPHRPGR